MWVELRRFTLYEGCHTIEAVLGVNIGPHLGFTAPLDDAKFPDPIHVLPRQEPLVGAFEC